MNFYQAVAELAKTHGNARKNLHNPHTEQNALVEDQDPIGIMGELYFALMYGYAADLKEKISGDDGYDFTIPLKFTVDIKTTVKTPNAKNLFVKQGTVKADIYVLAMYDDEKVDLLGWAWGKELLAITPRDFGRGNINHYIPIDKLRPMDSLTVMM